MACPDGVATFDYDTWAAIYPELAAKVSAQMGAIWFEQADLYLNNSCGSIVCSVAKRTLLLYMLVAHIAAMGIARAAGNGLVGRISSATQGTVTVAIDMPNQPQAAAWYQQTPYGADFWAATARYRTARYVANPGTPIGDGIRADGPLGPVFSPGGGWPNGGGTGWGYNGN